MPGMGGVENNSNFILNYREWEKYEPAEDAVSTATMRFAPVTGAEENIGYPSEGDFYREIIRYCKKNGLEVSIGDGVPDSKLQYGIEALQENGMKGSVFLKPYENGKLFERIEWSSSVAESVGVDIDSYNIVTMRNKANLEKKTAAQLKEIKAHLKTPFIIKGIFTEEDLELVKEVKPDIVVISNHGGRISTRSGSTLDFLIRNRETIRNNVMEIWIDGGIRRKKHLQIAQANGASSVLIGRPVISSFLQQKTFSLQ